MDMAEINTREIMKSWGWRIKKADYNLTNFGKHYSFIPDAENKKWMVYDAKRNRRPMSAQLNLLIEQARINDDTYPPNKKAKL